MTDGTTDVRSEVIVTATLVAVVVALSETVGRWVVAGGLGLDVDPVGLVLVSLAVVVGRPARPGSAAGMFVAGALLGDWYGGVVGAVAAFVATAVAVRLWTCPSGGGRDEWLSWSLRYGVVAVATVLAFAATGAWFSDVAGRAAFGTVVGRTVVSTLPVTLLGAPLVRWIAERAPDRSPRASGEPTTAQSVVVVATLACWVVGGYVGSFLFRALAMAPSGSVGRRISPVVEAFAALLGWQGTYAQLVLGILALTMLTITFHRN